MTNSRFDEFISISGEEVLLLFVIKRSWIAVNCKTEAIKKVMHCLSHLLRLFVTLDLQSKGIEAGVY